jgi:hypothetical protein
MPYDKLAARRKGVVSVSQLHREQVTDIGVVRGTAVAFVVTERGIHLFHVDCIIAGGVSRRAA